MSIPAPEEANYHDVLIENVRLRNQLDAQKRTLDSYKDAVKRLSFDLEMAQTDWTTSAQSPSVAISKARRDALQQAAEFLMDHGVITTGPELVQVCEQMTNLAVAPAPATAVIPNSTPEWGPSPWWK